MNCPLCLDQTLQAHHRHGMEIDICPHCKGVWLDRGELERLAERQPVAPPPPAGRGPRRDEPRNDRARAARDDRRRDRDDDDDDRSRRRRRKKSFADRLGDILEEVIDL